MTKLTIERLGELANATTPSVKYVGREIIAMARQLLAYEQAAKNPVAWVATDSEGFPEYNSHNEFSSSCGAGTPLYAAPVLPKQPELIGMKVSIDTGSDNIGHRLFGEIVCTSDSNGVPVLCIEVTENNDAEPAPTQPVIPEQCEVSKKPLEVADKLQDSEFRHGLKQGFSFGQTDDQDGFEKCLSAYAPRGKDNG